MNKQINDLYNINNKIQIINKNKKGGGAGALVAIWTFIFDLVKSLLYAIGLFVVDLIKIVQNPWIGFFAWSQWRFGYFWQYLWWCIKTCLYLLIFAFGGPIVTLVGIILIYVNLFDKLNERQDLQEEIMKGEEETSQNNI